MPKTFTESERTYIKTRLMEEAQVCLTLFGLRKTTVDELVKRVGIPKGTFYLFYSSKELLFFEVFLKLHEQLQREVLAEFEAAQHHLNAKTVTKLIFNLYKRVDATFLYSFAANGDLALLVRKLPSDLVEQHAKQDDFSMETLLNLLPGERSEQAVQVFSGALRAVFCVMTHRKEIGEVVFDDVVRMLLHGVVKQLFEEESK